MRVALAFTGEFLIKVALSVTQYVSCSNNDPSLVRPNQPLLFSDEGLTDCMRVSIYFRVVKSEIFKRLLTELTVCVRVLRVVSK